MTAESGETGGIIKSRFRIMGEGKIPQSEISHLSESHIRAFLTISDPSRWPPEIAHLKQYVSDETVA